MWAYFSIFSIRDRPHLPCFRPRQTISKSLSISKCLANGVLNWIFFIKVHELSWTKILLFWVNLGSGRCWTKIVGGQTYSVGCISLGQPRPQRLRRKLWTQLKFIFGEISCHTGYPTESLGVSTRKIDVDFPFCLPRGKVRGIKIPPSYGMLSLNR